MPTRLDHVLRVGAQHAAQRAAQRTAPTSGFGDREPVPRAVMNRALLLLNRDELYQYMQVGVRELQSLPDAQLFQRFRGIPREFLATLLERIDTYFAVSDGTVAVSNFLGRLYEGNYDERGAAIDGDDEDNEDDEYDEEEAAASVAAAVERRWPVPFPPPNRVQQFLDDVRYLRIENVRRTLGQSESPRRFATAWFMNGQPVLKCAIYRHSLELVELLMEHLTAEDMYQNFGSGRTALMDAASGSLEFVEALFPQAQLSINKRDHRGATAMDYTGTHSDSDPVRNFLASRGGVRAFPPGWGEDSSDESDDNGEDGEENTYQGDGGRGWWPAFYFLS